MQTPTLPAADNYPALVDWFIDNDPQFDSFLTTDDARGRVRRDLVNVLDTAGDHPEVLQRSIRELIGLFAGAVENHDDGEMTGFRAICRVLIYVLHEQHRTPFGDVAGDAGANFLRQHGFLTVP